MKATNITTELLVEDMKKTLEFYTTILGFAVALEFPTEKPFFSIIKNQHIEIMLYAREQFKDEIPSFEDLKTGGTIALYIGIEDIETEYENLKIKVEIIQKLHTTNYGTQEFSFFDCNGYVVMLHS